MWTNWLRVLDTAELPHIDQGVRPGWLTKIRRGLPYSSDRLIRSVGQPFSKEGRHGEHASSLSYAGGRLQPTSKLGGSAASQDPGLDDRRPHPVWKHPSHGLDTRWAQPSRVCAEQRAIETRRALHVDPPWQTV